MSLIENYFHFHSYIIYEKKVPIGPILTQPDPDVSYKLAYILNYFKNLYPQQVFSMRSSICASL